MYNMQLWETSGHAANYKENMFVFEVRFILLLDTVAMTSGEGFPGNMYHYARRLMAGGLLTSRDLSYQLFSFV